MLTSCSWSDIMSRFSTSSTSSKTVRWKPRRSSCWMTPAWPALHTNPWTVHKAPQSLSTILCQRQLAEPATDWTRFNKKMVCVLAYSNWILPQTRHIIHCIYLNLLNVILRSHTSRSAICHTCNNFKSSFTVHWKKQCKRTPLCAVLYTATN